jgi:flagellar operon protein
VANKIGQGLPPVLPGEGPAPGLKQDTGKARLFKESLEREIQRQKGVKLSAHAEKRLQQQKIALTPRDLSNIEQALRLAAAKGSRDSLILYGDLALVASVANRTVVTAIGGERMKEHVFTNIDSAVILSK